MKVLLVDDSLTMRRIQKTQLSKLGITDVVEAVDGNDGLAKLESSMPVDAVLLDWNMPEMDGLTFLKTLRTNARYKDVKVIMCTSESEKARVMEAIGAGANDYIVKPFTQEGIKQKLGL